MRSGVPQFQGIKLAQDPGTACEFPDIHRVKIRSFLDRLLIEKPAEIGDGGNSGFQALNLAVQFGARRIVLVGFDMRIDQGMHWHGPHPKGLNNPSDKTVSRWRRTITAAAPMIADLGVEVLNASPISTLSVFRKVDFGDVMRATRKMKARQ